MRVTRSSGIKSFFVFSLFFGLCGCAASNSSGNSSGTGTGGSGAPQFVPPTSGDYLLQVPLDQSVSVSTIDKATGVLSAPVSTGSDSSYVLGHMTVTPSNSFLYAMSVGFNAIVGYRLTGPGLQLQLLELGSSTPYEFMKNTAESIAIHPSGKFLYGIETGVGAGIEEFNINTSTGMLQEIGTHSETSSTDMRFAVFDPAGHFMFVNDLTNARIFVYQVDPSTGALSPIAGSPFTVASSGQPIQLALDPTASFLYAPLAAGGMAGFAVNPSTGALTNLPGSPFATSNDPSRPGGTPASIAINPATDTIYISNFPYSNITEFAINQSTGVPTMLSGSPVAVPGAQYGYVLDDLLVDPDANILLGSSFLAQNNIDAMSIATGTGALSSLPAAPFSGVPNATDLYFVRIP